MLNHNQGSSLDVSLWINKGKVEVNDFLISSMVSILIEFHLHNIGKGQYLYSCVAQQETSEIRHRLVQTSMEFPSLRSILIC